MIETARLRLRSWRDEDRDWYAEQCACPIVMEHLGGPKSRDECDKRIDRMLARQAAGEPVFWVVERRTDGARIGDAGLKRVDAAGAPMQGELEIGWRLAREAWGRGYAKEAALAALDFAFRRLAAAQVIALTSPRNTQSRGLMHRLGMAHRPNLDYVDARFGPADNPTFVHVIEAEDWKALRN